MFSPSPLSRLLGVEGSWIGGGGQPRGTPRSRGPDLMLDVPDVDLYQWTKISWPVDDETKLKIKAPAAAGWSLGYVGGSATRCSAPSTGRVFFIGTTFFPHPRLVALTGPLRGNLFGGGQRAVADYFLRYLRQS